MSVSPPVPPNLLHLMCSCSNEWSPSTWSSELGAIETLFLTPLYQLCPPSGWQLYLGSDAFSSHNDRHNPTFCLSHALLQWHPRDLSFCHSFPYSDVSLHCCQRFFPINQPWPGIPYRLGPKLLTLTFKTLDSQTPDCPCRLTSCCSFIEPHPPQTQALYRRESREGNWHNPERSTQTTISGWDHTEPSAHSPLLGKSCATFAWHRTLPWRCRSHLSQAIRSMLHLRSCDFLCSWSC